MITREKSVICKKSASMKPLFTNSRGFLTVYYFRLILSWKSERNVKSAVKREKRGLKEAGGKDKEIREERECEAYSVKVP